MILLILARWSITGLVPSLGADPAGTGRGGGAVARIASNSSAGVAPEIWAAAVEPADVPMVRSAVVTSSPASDSPAITPISQAFPVEPPPPRTSARPGLGFRGFEAVFKTVFRGKEDVAFMGVAFRELPCVALPTATICVARSWTPGERPMRILRSWDSPPVERSRSRENYHAPMFLSTGNDWCPPSLDQPDRVIGQNVCRGGALLPVNAHERPWLSFWNRGWLGCLRSCSS